jgi:FkbM family methyltransferase
MVVPSRVTRLRDLVRFARDVATLAPNRSARARLWLAAMALPIKARVPGLSSTPWRVRVWIDGHVHELALADRSDFQVLAEVLVDREYDVRPAQPPRLVVDLGAHVGISVAFFHAAFPRARILAVEPDPATFRLLERNVGHLPRVELRRVAVGKAHGAGAVVPGAASWENRVVASSAGDVEIVTLDELATDDAEVPALLKIDVEGAEWDVLSAADLKRFSTIVGELHPAAIPVGTDEFFALLDGFEVTPPGDACGHGTFVAVRR